MLAADSAGAPATAPVPEETEPVGEMPDRNPALDHAVAEAARADRPEAVQRLLARAHGLSPAYAALLRGEAAQILFTLNRDEDAYALVAAGARAGRQRRCRWPATWRGWPPGAWAGPNLPCPSSRRAGTRS